MPAMTVEELQDILKDLDPKAGIGLYKDGNGEIFPVHYAQVGYWDDEGDFYEEGAEGRTPVVYLA